MKKYSIEEILAEIENLKEKVDLLLKKSVQSRLIPLIDWPQHHTWPPIGGLRHLVHNCEKNGFDKVIKKVGSRILIDEEAFFKWAEIYKKDKK
jgi:hypothetical protein